MRFHRGVPIVVPVIVCAGWIACGCQSVNVDGPNKTMASTPDRQSFPAADESNPVVGVVTIWELADGPGLNKTMTRGFAGQIFFRTRNLASPVTVDGKVRIYLFDDQGPVDEQAKPIHQFDYTSEAWATHLVSTVYGPAYQVFIPYVRPGFNRVQCALQVRYTPESGQTVLADMSKAVLPGPDDKAEIQVSSSKSPASGEATEPVGPLAHNADSQGEDQQGRIAGSETDGLIAQVRRQMQQERAMQRNGQEWPPAAAEPDGAIVKASATDPDDRIRQLEKTVQLLNEALSKHSEQQPAASSGVDTAEPPLSIGTQRFKLHPLDAEPPDDNAGFGQDAISDGNPSAAPASPAGAQFPSWSESLHAPDDRESAVRTAPVSDWRSWLNEQRYQAEEVPSAGPFNDFNRRRNADNNSRALNLHPLAEPVSDRTDGSVIRGREPLDPAANVRAFHGPIENNNPSSTSASQPDTARTELPHWAATAVPGWENRSHVTKPSAVTNTDSNGEAWSGDLEWVEMDSAGKRTYH